MAHSHSGPQVRQIQSDLIGLFFQLTSAATPVFQSFVYCEWVELVFFYFTDLSSYVESRQMTRAELLAVS